MSCKVYDYLELQVVLEKSGKLKQANKLREWVYHGYFGRAGIDVIQGDYGVEAELAITRLPEDWCHFDE